jgi:hypothetical protein
MIQRGHIQPLRSVSPVREPVTGALPIQERDSARNHCWFITYAYKSYQRAFDVGTALKAVGQNAIVDIKQDLYKSKHQDSREKTQQLFNRASHVIVICDRNYLKEITGEAETPLNTRFIYNLIEKEFRQHGRNNRFVPIIDKDNLGKNDIPTPIRNFSKLHLDFVFKALHKHRTANIPSSNSRRREVAIERTVYGSH